MKLFWTPKPLMKEVKKRADKAAKIGADIVKMRAINKLDSYDMPYETGYLRERIKVYPLEHLQRKSESIAASQYIDVEGGYIVAAEAKGDYDPDNYHATFVELGSYKLKDGTGGIPPKPFLRPALKSSRRLIRGIFKRLIEEK